MATATAQPAPAPALPIIDISGLSRGPAERRAVAQALHEASVETGFFYISEHGVSDALIDAVFAQSHALFALPLEQKLALASRNTACYHGYEPLQGQTLEAGMPPDLKEGFNLGDELPANHPAVIADPNNYGPNQWPSGLPGFRATLSGYHAEMLRVSHRLMQAMALGLGLPEDYFDDFCETPIAVIRLLHYPPQPADPAPGEKGCGAHTDWGGLTVLLQDAAAGLEVMSAAGSWIKAPPIPGTFVVNIGDMFARWTNGLYRSTVHRVINVSGRDRYSVPFFFDGRSDYLVSCIPACRAPGQTPHFATVTVKDHLEEMRQRTYEAA
jgi:isopenicillin N synthase-like dioxygenase